MQRFERCILMHLRITTRGKKMTIEKLGVFATLKTNKWYSTKTDRRIAEAAANASNLPNSKRLDGRKHCIANTGAFKQLHKTISKLGNDFRFLSGAYDESGRRFLPNSNISRVAAMVRAAQDEVEELCDQFDAELPGLINEARAELKEYFSEDDYPSQPARELFNVSWTLTPITSLDNLSGVLATVEGAHAGEIKRIIDNEAQTRQAAVDRLQQSVAKKLLEQLHRIADGCASYDQNNRSASAFRDTFLSRLQEILKVVPEFNVTDNPEMAALHRDLTAALAGKTLPVLRNNPNARAELERETRAAVSKLGKMF